MNLFPSWGITFTLALDVAIIPLCHHCARSLYPANTCLTTELALKEKVNYVIPCLNEISWAGKRLLYPLLSTIREKNLPMINTPNLHEMERKETKVQKCFFLPQYTHFETEEKERRVRMRLKNMGLKFNKTHLLAALLVEGGEVLDEEKGVTLC